MNEQKKDIQIKLEIRKDKLLGLAFGILSFIFLFLKWFKFSLLGYSESYSILHSEMFDISTLMGLAKILAIVCIVLFVVYLVSCLTDLEKLIPALSKYKTDKIFPLGYFGVYFISLLFNLIGTWTCDGSEMVKPAFGWWFAIIFVILGIVVTVIPNIGSKIKSLIKK